MPSKFLTGINLQSMASQFPEFGLLALAMMMAMITGGIDLSVVSISNFTGVIAALILSGSVDSSTPAGLAILYAVAAVVAISIICGPYKRHADSHGRGCRRFLRRLERRVCFWALR